MSIKATQTASNSQRSIFQILHLLSVGWIPPDIDIEIPAITLAYYISG